VNQAIQTLVPTLLGSLHENVQADDIDSTHLESAVVAEGQSDLLTGGINVDQIDQGQGNQLIASLFGGNDTNQVASALSGAGAGGGDLIKRLLPMLAPIVLAYVGKQFAAKNAGAQAQAAPGGGIGDVLGGLLGGGGGGAANNPLGNILGSVLGGNQGGAIGNILFAPRLSRRRGSPVR